MSTILSIFKRILTIIWKTINGIRLLLINILLLGLIACLFVIFTEEETIQVKNNSALVLDLKGNIVDQKQFVEPLKALLSQSQNPDDKEILLSDLLQVIKRAAQDSNIKMLVIEPGNLGKAGISKLQAVGDAIKNFQSTGKQVIAVGNFYNQQQYFLASFADRIFLNPEGGVMIDGLARYNMYFKSALDKLDISTHIFRVGSYKSAVEPFLRNDMSPEAKQANLALIEDLWQSYSSTVSANRNIPADSLALNAEHYLAQLDKAQGSSAQVALNLKWVDTLATENEFEQFMQQQVATDKHHFRQVSFDDYLPLAQNKISLSSKQNIGIIVAEGKILNGKQPAGEIGGESTSELLRQARFDDNIKAVVLRVDSPGGSAFASEQIRQQILALKQAGKPVVVSMGSLAASGGYWISANADYIYATPTTITGSIGIFGMFATFEKSLAKLGIHTDGVATTDWAGLSITRNLSPQVGAAIQKHIEHGYQDFISLVANARHMTQEKVESIAQGRVWTGKKALELGLVDALGDMDNAIAKAAKLAKLRQYNTKLIQQKLSTEQELLQKMFSTASTYLPMSISQSTAIDILLAQFKENLTTLTSFNDPNGIYLYCDICSR